MKKSFRPISITIINDFGLEKLPTKKLKKVIELALDIKHIGNASINLIIVSDSEIHKINNQFLKHDYPTDVISFDLTEGKFLEGEIYVSAETAKKQAEEYGVGLNEELLRLAVHGALHLIGYDDDTDENKQIMNSLENACIAEAL